MADINNKTFLFYCVSNIYSDDNLMKIRSLRDRGSNRKGNLVLQIHQPYLYMGKAYML
jgi:hypothetical protein